MLSPQIRRCASSPPGASDGQLRASQAADDGSLPTLDLGELEKRALREALRRARGCQAEAARLLRISRFALRRRLERYGL